MEQTEPSAEPVYENYHRRDGQSLSVVIDSDGETIFINAYARDVSTTMMLSHTEFKEIEKAIHTVIEATAKLSDGEITTERKANR